MTTSSSSSEPRPQRQPNRRRRRWILISVIAAVLLVGLTLTGYLLAPKLGIWLLERKVIPALEKRFGRKVRFRRAKAGIGFVELRGVRVSGPRDCAGAPLFAADAIELRFAFWPLLSGRLELTDAKIARPRFCLRVAKDGRDNFRDILRKLRRRKVSRRIRLKLSAIHLDQGALRFHDDGRGISLRAPSLLARLRPGGRSTITLHRVIANIPKLAPLQAAQLRLAFRTRLGRLSGSPELTIEGARIALHDQLVLTDINGTATRSTKGRVDLALDGGYGDARQHLWSARGWLALAHLGDPRRASLELAVRAQRFSLEKLAPILDRTVLPEAAKAHLELDLKLALRRGVLGFSGRANLAGLTVFHRYVAPRPVRDIGFRATLEGSYDLGRDHLRVTGATLRRGRVSAELSGEVRRLRGTPRLALSLRVPRTRCEAALAAIPPDLVPRLERFRVSGGFAAHLRLEADFKYLTLNSVTLDADVDLRRCRVVSVPWPLSVERLRREFLQEIHEGGRRFRFYVGPKNPLFTPYDRISPHMINAVLTTEDGRFFHHRGFIYHEFKKALVRNLIAGRFVFGASSITMQTVKNVLLTRRKTLSRKLQELILTWHLERRGARPRDRGLSKRRIMEIYLNVIEFGPGIYGIGAAADHFFAKTPDKLDPHEAAYLATILPNPKSHYRRFCYQKVSRYWTRVVHRILRLMHRYRRLSKSELEIALDTEIRFATRPESNTHACLARIARFRRQPR